MLSMLDLFSREHTTMTAEQIAETLALSRTTCYRYTRELSRAGLLVSNGGAFMLGPRIIQLDRRIIESDPLLNAGRPVLVALADALGATGLISTSYDDQIISIFQHEGARSPIALSMGRGTTMPAFRTATSKVILASMSRSRLKRIWSRHRHEPDCLALGVDWLAFWKALQAIKRQGYWSSLGEVDAGLAGIAAPIVYESGDVAGSMSLVFTADEFALFDVAALGARVVDAAARVSRALAKEISVGAAHPPVPGRRRSTSDLAKKPRGVVGPRA